MFDEVEIKLTLKNKCFVAGPHAAQQHVDGTM
jgi:hypothetical protein